MPTYTYKCKAEEPHIFDIKQKFADDALTTCIHCDQPVRKVVNSVGIVFKGSGYYVTDNRSKSKNPANAATDSAKTEGKSDAPSESKAETKNDSKSASKSDSKSESKPTTKTESKSSPKPTS